MRTCLLLSALWAGAADAVVDENTASILTELVTGALGKEGRFEVLSSADVRRQVELEADKQSLGCDAKATSCLAEIAGAMGAQLVVYGQLGALDDVVILSLNLFDSAQGRAVGRVALRETSLKELSAKVDGAVIELTAPFLAQHGAEAPRVKLLVLDLEPPRQASAVVDNGRPAQPGDSLFNGGVGASIGGVVVVVVGVGFWLAALEEQRKTEGSSLDAVSAEETYNRRDGFGLIGIGAGAVGGVALLAGGVMLGLAVLE